MAWVELTVQTYRKRFDAEETNAVLDGAPYPEESICEILSQVAADIVSRVNACRRSRGQALVYPPARRVPPGSVGYAYTLAQRMVATNLPSLAALQGEARDSEVTAARDYLSDIASCDVDHDDDGASAYVIDDSNQTPIFGGYPKMDFVS